MKIVIDIPEKINNRLRSMLGHGYTLWDEDVKIIAEAIYNGQTQPDVPNTNVGDMISRQAAIALLENLFKNTIVEFGYNSYEEANDRIKLLCDGVSDAMEVIETMDSAQPDLQPTCNQLATDCISRRAAIGAVHKNYDTILDFKSDGRTVADSFEDIINTLPSVQPEQRKGKWIDMGDFEQCSACTGTRLKEVNTVYGKAIWIKSAYCPNCGAKMEV